MNKNILAPYEHSLKSPVDNNALKKPLHSAAQHGEGLCVVAAGRSDMSDLQVTGARNRYFKCNGRRKSGETIGPVSKVSSDPPEYP